MAQRPGLTPAAASPAVGHEALREHIRDAWRAERLPQSLLLLGPEGVGKQTLALWTATLIQCENAGPCHECRSCRLSGRLEHPDIHWHFPLARPKGASSRKKLREKLEEARWKRLEELRADPFEPREAEGVTGIYLAAVEEIRAQASRRPAMADSVVFVIGSADRMVSQSANPEAANAFLKLLEEPPPFAYLILTSSRPDALLPTIRSRSLSLRVPPLDDGSVETFLIERRHMDPSDAASTARLAQGSIGQALRLASGLEVEERATAVDLLRAAFSPHAAERLKTAAGFASWGARDGLARTLGFLSELLRDVLSVVVGRPEGALDPEIGRRVADRHTLDPCTLLDALECVEESREAAAANANPQAVVAVLLLDLHTTLTASARP